MQRKMAAILAINLTACHPLEDRASAALKDRLTDPLSLQLREVRRSETNNGAVCGEFNSKNRMGGYVGFKPFTVGPDDRLVMVEDDASLDDLSTFIEGCGTIEQRAGLVLMRAGTKATPPIGASAPLSAITPPPDHPNGQLPFQLASAGRVELLQCHMDECSWWQLQSVKPVRTGGDSVLVRVVARRGSSTHDSNKDPEYPATYDPSVPIKWNSEMSVSYVLCSLPHPSLASAVDGKWYVDRLTVISPAGFQRASVQEYVNVCHKKSPGTWNDDTLKNLGYAEVEGNQSTVSTEAAAVAMMR